MLERITSFADATGDWSGAQAEKNVADRNERQGVDIPAKPRPEGAGDLKPIIISAVAFEILAVVTDTDHRADEQRRDAGANQTCGAQPQQS